VFDWLPADLNRMERRVDPGFLLPGGGAALTHTSTVDQSAVTRLTGDVDQSAVTRLTAQPAACMPASSAQEEEEGGLDIAGRGVDSPLLDYSSHPLVLGKLTKMYTKRVTHNNY
jgi:hypothetical protein